MVILSQGTGTMVLYNNITKSFLSKILKHEQISSERDFGTSRKEDVWYDAIFV